jgi:hypothetical protein
VDDVVAGGSGAAVGAGAVGAGAGVDVTVGSSGPLDDEADPEDEEEEDEEPGALVDSEVSDGLVDEGVGVGVDTAVDAGSVDGDDEPESGPPSALRTLATNPSFAYACVVSHIITPPKLSNFFVYSITCASFEAGTYPVLAAVVSAGTPIKTLTFLFWETVLAQLSHSSKLYFEAVASVSKLFTPQ